MKEYLTYNCCITFAMFNQHVPILYKQLLLDCKIEQAARTISKCRITYIYLQLGMLVGVDIACSSNVRIKTFFFISSKDE